jgi:hypothetical protein
MIANLEQTGRKDMPVTPLTVKQYLLSQTNPDPHWRVRHGRRTTVGISAVRGAAGG